MDRRDCGLLPGAASPASLAATLRTVNVLRSFASTGPVVLNREALAAALMMRAAGRLSHARRPGSRAGPPGEPRAQAPRTTSSVARAPRRLVGYVDDEGIDSLGHRRRLLNPAAAMLGSGSTGSSNALYVLGGPAVPVAPGTAVAWSPSARVPWP